jgi:hypothetical protein
MFIKTVLALLCLISITQSLSLRESHLGNYAWYTVDEGPRQNRC